MKHLIDNAVKYANKGQINISLNQKNDKVNIEIQDKGIGIFNKYQKNLFVHFSQESVEYAKKFQGIGTSVRLTCKVSSQGMKN